jgi:hypothetical protein
MVHLFTTIARLDIRSAALHLSSGVKMAENHLLEIGHRADPKGDGLPERTKPAAVLAAVKARPLGVRAGGTLCRLRIFFAASI